MSRHDAFEEEMPFRTLSDQDAERLLRGQAPEASQFAELAEFAQALRQELSRPAPDDPALVSRLAQTARSAGHSGEAETMPITAPVRPRRRRLMPARLALVARAAGVIAVVPLLFAGLAVADITLPEPARKAFEAVGVSLPNQPATDEASEAGGSGSDETDRESADKTSTGEDAQKGKGGSNAVENRKHGTAKPNPARAGGRANGEQGRGRALGKRGLAPGQVQPPGQLRAPGQLKKDGAGEAIEKPNAGTPSASSAPSTPPGKANPAGQGQPG